MKAKWSVHKLCQAPREPEVGPSGAGKFEGENLIYIDMRRSISG